jgi:hypothetical protein
MNQILAGGKRKILEDRSRDTEELVKPIMKDSGN